MSQVIAELVKQKRKELNYTQEELALRSGVGLRFLRELEQGKPSLQLDKVNQVLFMFGYEIGPVAINRKTLNDESS